MTKLLVEVYLPTALDAYDVQIPADMQLHQITSLVAAALSQMSGFLYTPETPILCDRKSGEILNVNMTAWELGLQNGSKLMLI